MTEPGHEQEHSSDSTSPKGQRPADYRRWWQKKRYKLLLIVFVGLGAAEFVATRYYPAYFWYQVAAQVEYQGEIIDVGGVVECERAEPIGGLLLPFERPTGQYLSYQTSTIAFAKRLPDGSVIILAHGMTCNSRIHQRLTYEAGTVEIFDRLKMGHNHEVIYPGNDPSRFPLLRWLNDAEAPTEAEAYLTDSYYQDSRARFRFVKYEVRRLRSSEVSDPRNMMAVERERALVEIPWLADQLTIPRGDSQGFRGDHAYLIEKSEWLNDPEASRALADESDQEYRIIRERLRSPAFEQFPSRAVVLVASRCLVERPTKMCNALRRLRLFLPHEDTLVVSGAPSIPGMLPLYFTPSINSKDRLSRLRFPDGEAFDAREAWAVYDQGMGHIYVRLFDSFRVRNLFGEREIQF